MNKYQEGKIYKIINDSIPGVYYGSTIQTLKARLKGHRFESKKNKSNSSKPLFEFGEPKIILIQNKPCNSKEELLKRESFYIRNFDCINKYIPDRTKKEYYLDNKEKIREKRKKYRVNNLDRIKEQKKKYREDNKDKRKIYYENNKDKLREYNKKYREDNKEKIKEKINCECGGSFQYKSKAGHLKTNKHQNYIKPS